MCQQACPAECITIVAGEHPKIAYEKYPVVFDIDMMRCVFCGFCVDACPKDAIWMTRNYEMAFFTREDAVFSIDRLRETPEEIAKHGYGYRPYYPGDGTTPPTGRVAAAGPAGQRASATGCARRASRCRTAIPGPGPLNAPRPGAEGLLGRSGGSASGAGSRLQSPMTSASEYRALFDARGATIQPRQPDSTRRRAPRRPSALLAHWDRTAGGPLARRRSGRRIPGAARRGRGHDRRRAVGCDESAALSRGGRRATR